MRMKKILILSYDVNPYLGSEAGKAHFWLLAIAENYNIDVFVHNKHREDIETYPYPENIHFSFVKTDPRKETEYARIKRYDKVNQLFLDAVEKTFIERTRSGEYEFVHFLTPSSIFAYNDFFKKANFKYVVGPLGGGIPTPKGFAKLLSFREYFIDKYRNLYYSMLKRKRIYVEYYESASRLIIGTDYLYDFLPTSTHEKTEIQFDTLVDMDELSDDNRSPEKRNNGNIIKIIYTGRLSPQKGIKMLFEAFLITKEKEAEIGHNLCLEIFGDGSERKRIEALVNRYKLEKSVFIHGNVPRKEVLQNLKSGDLYCLPTIREPGGQSILEAMAAGLPIITSDYGGPKFSVTDDCGIKIPVDNYDNYVSNLADAIIKLAEDEPLRRKMGEAARKRVREEFSLEALKNRIPEIYEEIN